MSAVFLTEGWRLWAGTGVLAACGTGLYLWAPILWRPAAWVLWILAAGAGAITAFFFRDPERRSAAGSESILSPADGRVVAVEVCEEQRHFRGQARRVAIFMHLGNVHVQRTPCAGQLLWTHHRPGRWLPAWSARAARENEQHWYAFRGAEGDFAVVQIAGLLARRTRCWLRSDQSIRAAPAGLDRAGVPKWMLSAALRTVAAKVGDRVRAGETVLGAVTRQAKSPRFRIENAYLLAAELLTAFICSRAPCDPAALETHASGAQDYDIRSVGLVTAAQWS
jgi:phosphatidylserine decarboxylase